MSKKLVVWALAVSLGFGCLTTSIFAEDAKTKTKEVTKTEAKAEPKTEESCSKKVKKSHSCRKTVKKVEKVEEIPTEPAPDAKTPEKK